VQAHPGAATQNPRTSAGRDQEKGIRAREELRLIIAGLRPAEPGTGRYTYVHMRRFPATASHEATALEDVSVWRAADGSGLMTTAGVSTDPAAAISYPPGGLGLTMGVPAPRPENLAGQFDYYRGQLHLRLFEMVAIMNAESCLTSQQRAAMLQVLADTDGLFYLGRIEDRQGRVGVAFALQGKDPRGNDLRDVLIFDESTGALLSYEQHAAVMPPTSPARTPAVMSYVLYLGCGYTDQEGLPLP
jgi:hypothetical protein